MYPKDVPDLVADQSNQTSRDNIFDALKNIRPLLAGRKNCGVNQDQISNLIRPTKTGIWRVRIIENWQVRMIR